MDTWTRIEPSRADTVETGTDTYNAARLFHPEIRSTLNEVLAPLAERAGDVLFYGTAPRRSLG